MYNKHTCTIFILNWQILFMYWGITYMNCIVLRKLVYIGYSLLYTHILKCYRLMVWVKLSGERVELRHSGRFLASSSKLGMKNNKDKDKDKIIMIDSNLSIWRIIVVTYENRTLKYLLLRDEPDNMKHVKNEAKLIQILSTPFWGYH